MADTVMPDAEESLTEVEAARLARGVASRMKELVNMDCPHNIMQAPSALLARFVVESISEKSDTTPLFRALVGVGAERMAALACEGLSDDEWLRDAMALGQDATALHEFVLYALHESAAALMCPGADPETSKAAAGAASIHLMVKLRLEKAVANLTGREEEPLDAIHLVDLDHMSPLVRAAWAALPEALQVLSQVLWALLRERAAYLRAAPKNRLLPPTKSWSSSSSAHMQHLAGWTVAKTLRDPRLCKQGVRAVVPEVLRRFILGRTPATHNFFMSEPSLKTNSLHEARPEVTRFLFLVIQASGEHMDMHSILVHQQDALRHVAGMMEQSQPLWEEFLKMLSALCVHLSDADGEPDPTAASEEELDEREQEAAELDAEAHEARAAVTEAEVEWQMESLLDEANARAWEEEEEKQLEENLRAAAAGVSGGGSSLPVLYLTTAEARSIQQSMVMRVVHAMLKEDLHRHRLKAVGCKLALRDQTKARELAKAERATVAKAKAASAPGSGTGTGTGAGTGASGGAGDVGGGVEGGVGDGDDNTMQWGKMTAGEMVLARDRLMREAAAKAQTAAAEKAAGREDRLFAQVMKRQMDHDNAAAKAGERETHRVEVAVEKERHARVTAQSKLAKLRESVEKAQRISNERQRATAVGKARAAVNEREELEQRRQVTAQTGEDEKRAAYDTKRATRQEKHTTYLDNVDVVKGKGTKSGVQLDKENVPP